MSSVIRIATLSILALGIIVQTAIAQETPPRISALTIVDRDFMADQLESIDTLARSRLGRQLRRDKDSDLATLQALLDRNLVSKGQSLQLQAMGIVLGNLLADELEMDWVVYEDRLGRSRALRMGLSDHYLFPVTMISRRAEVGAAVDVQAIYNKALLLMQPHMPPKPFQYR